MKSGPLQIFKSIYPHRVKTETPVLKHQDTVHACTILTNVFRLKNFIIYSFTKTIL